MKPMRLAIKEPARRNLLILVHITADDGPVALVLSGGWVAIAPRDLSAPEPHLTLATPAPSAPFSKTFDLVEIQDVPLGRRAVGTNPLGSEVDDTLPEPDPQTWRQVHLLMAKPLGEELRIELLRPLDWIAKNEVATGKTIHLDLRELGASGPAKVVQVSPCPPIQSGPGNVITGRFIHTSSGNLLNLKLEGDSDAVGVTANHSYWSVDRQSYVAAGELTIGEQLQTLTGFRTVARITPRPNDEPVYNREHVYHVGQSGTLVHNSCVGGGGKGPKIGFNHPNHVVDLPFGYKEKAFRRFVQRTQDEFRSVGFDDAVFFMQGSSVSGRKFLTGELLNSRRGIKPSDYDAAIVSPKILARAEELGLNVLNGPLTADQVVKRRIACQFQALSKIGRCLLL